MCLAFKVLTSFYFLGRVFVCLLKAVFTALKSLDVIHSCTSNSISWSLVASEPGNVTVHASRTLFHASYTFFVVL